MNRDGNGMESVDEVLADIRQRAINCANEGAGRPGVAMTENRLVSGLLLSFAERLAAAVARERGRTGTPPQNADAGNAATLRSALAAMVDFWEVHGVAFAVRVCPEPAEDANSVDAERGVVMEKAREALAATEDSRQPATESKKTRKGGGK